MWSVNSQHLSIFGQGVFAPGSDVFVEGLTKCPETWLQSRASRALWIVPETLIEVAFFQAFNGLSGKVQRLDKQTGRYDVLLVSNSGYQLAKIKGGKLKHKDLQYLKVKEHLLSLYEDSSRVQ